MERNEQISGLGNMRHWTAIKGEREVVIWGDERRVEAHRVAGWVVFGPFVLEAQQPGAVEALHELDALATAVIGEPKAVNLVEATVVRRIVRRALGDGQQTLTRPAGAPGACRHRAPAVGPR